MNARRKSVTTKQVTGRTFPYRVDILVPPFGLDQWLDDMFEWCRENVPPEGWISHSWQARRARLADPKHWCRFYFMDADKAEGLCQTNAS